MLKKLVSCFLILTLLVCAVSCSKTDEEEAPEGMKSVTVDGEPFTLFVPQAWTDNSLSGISGAYYSSVPNLSVSARYFTPADPNTTAEQYMDACNASVSSSMNDKGFSLIELNADTQLGGEPAKRNSYTFIKDEATIRVTQISAKYGSDIISLYIYCPADQYDSRTEELDKIRTNFKFKARSAVGETIIDKDTPDGMKLASNPEIEYRLYVPTSWICDPGSGASDAYFPESERSNVVVTSFVPAVSMSVEDYFKDCDKQYKDNFAESYTLISGPEIRKNPIENLNMYCYVFSVNVGGVEVKLLQAVFAFNQTFYTITYTARTERFDEHLDDVYKILDSFRFM